MIAVLGEESVNGVKPRFVQSIFFLVLIASVLSCRTGLSPSTSSTSWQSLLSPLPTPTRYVPPPTPTPFVPTPTPTLGTVPTLTPPKLREWPTPTPTPLPFQAERARQFVVECEGIPADQLFVHRENVVIRPSTGEELWIGRILDTDSGHYFEVWVDSVGRVDRLPDFSEQAAAQIAERENIPSEQLVVVNSVNAVFPLTRQLVWRAKIIDSKGTAFFEANFDLDGNPVDVEAIQAAEESARQTQCHKLDDGLCLVLLKKSPQEMQDVSIWLYTEAYVDVVTSRIADSGYEHRQSGQSVYARLPKQFILELATLDAVRFIGADWPAKTVPLDSNLFFAFEEAGGEVALKVRTEKIYGCCNFEIDAEFSQPSQERLEIAISGIYHPEICLTVLGPATLEVNLGALDGKYELDFTYEKLKDHHRLTVSPEHIALRPGNVAFTWSQYERWLRLPPDTVWFVTEAPIVDRSGTPVAVDRLAYDLTAEAFFAAVEDLGAEPFTPIEGVYSNRRFIPPWPSWSQPHKGYTQIPIDDRSFHSFKWPHIRYYHYTGPITRLAELLREYYTEVFWVTGYTWDGKYSTPDGFRDD